MNVQLTLPKPHQGQQQVLDSKARFKVLLCGRRWGKSLISQIISILGILEGKSIGYVTPTYQLGKIFFQDILKLIPTKLIRSANKTDLIINLITGGALSFLTGERLDNFRGRKFHTVIIDEAAYIPDLENAWLNSIRPTLTDYQGDCLFISTPRGKNYFYSLYNKGLNKEDGYECWHFTSYDNPHISASEIDLARNELPDAAFRQEYLAEPGENTSNPFGTDNIKDNTITTLSYLPSQILGIDLGKHNDYTVITGLDEHGAMSYFDRFKLPWALTIEKIKALPDYTLKVIDSTGVGDAVFEQLSATCTNITGFKFTSTSKPQIVMELVKSLELGKVKVNEVTASEMMVFEYKIQPSGHIKYEAQSGFHDDTVMSLCMANHYLKQASLSNYSGWIY
ncbi:terminase family protein [Mucilaginibacter gracilis]|uniref:Terminase family protein n=1 Tax=Mucilaginibacter gracilis TaxID=423350 RepID=A0A495J2S0_9SPHI|nr:terminase family protein [Mucilaginibacter gracilis]RKR82644.1 terminase family protein [Mucilaginibacter gracilis]